MLSKVQFGESLETIRQREPRPCRKCGVVFAEKSCKACDKARYAAYRNANSKKVRAATAAWRAANREKVAAYEANYWLENKDRKTAQKAANPQYKEKNAERAREAYRRDPEAANLKAAEWRSKNPEKVKQYSAEYYANNAEACREKTRKWRSENPEGALIQNQNRRAKLKNAGGVLPRDIRKKLFVLQRGLCACCAEPLGEGFHLDHIQPLALGGSNSPENMQLLRSSCNTSKGSKHPVDFMQSRGFLL